ncbi:MAG TPA: glutamine-hydrolyzing carbamoyl-phosphate synthase small subunit [Acidimicrobiales bacterium]|nr:glutamine-hydrolyzing carbamoyl-phosphate synthase small subunit [Acidimicrobiales bacterium]
MSAPTRAPALLVLADGEIFEGEAAGASAPVSTGELVFNTALSGYQEVLTDPSYAGQVITFTYPHIGNYGVNADDDESGRAHCRGLLVRDLTPEPSNWRASESLEGWLARRGVPAMTGIDTRRLTRHLRDKGAMPCAFGTAGEAVLREAAAQAPPTDGRDLVTGVTTPVLYVCGDGPRRVVAYDFGVKQTMLRHLGRLATVTVVPASTPASDVLALDPDGVFLSNGPGDPAALAGPISAIADLLGRVPIFGICLGHQLLCAALGGSTYKLPFGHHGTNHPVQRLSDGAVEITSQNHNYAVTGVPGAEVTHASLNDGVVEGVSLRQANAFSVQYHPEAGPGPHDAGYLFATFAEMLG